MKAMILAAGRGERLKPYTDHTPKPLLPIGNTTLIDHLLEQLKKAGISDVVMNVHHLRDQMMQHCGDGEKYGVQLRYSIEEELLETGGGIVKALPLLGVKPFLVISADIWTDYPLEKLKLISPSHAHLIFVDNPDFHPKGDFGLREDHIVVEDSLKKLTYGSFGVFHPQLFEHQAVEFFRLTKVLKPAIAKALITGEHYRGEWHNVGGHASYTRINHR